MHDGQIVIIGRARRYSPNSTEKDAAILREVAHRLQEKGLQTTVLPEDEADSGLPTASVYVTMGRSETLLQQLEVRERQGATVVNSPTAVRLCCRRREQMERLEQAGIRVAPREGSDGYWVKRGDTSAQTPSDVRFCPDKASATAAEQEMKDRGIIETDTRAHVTGDLVKFYGVRGTPFFRHYYPGDDGQSKFGDEAHNGRPHHYPFDTRCLQQMVNRAAELLDTDIYGGDCIIRPDGTPVLIDFNDWPSFSRCREEAAAAIATRILQKVGRQETTEKIEK